MATKENNKYYAVRRGYRTGIYTTWEGCRQNIQGYSGAEFKKFNDYAEAAKYMTARGDCVYHVFGDVPQSVVQRFRALSDNLTIKTVVPSKCCYAYVDGSYNTETGQYGYGVVFCCSGETEEFYNSGSDSEYVSMRNVAGEIQGALQAVMYAVLREMDKITIYYDYMGIEKWAIGEWKANKSATREYVRFMKEVMSLIQIEFIKVAAHTGVPGNERADQLAKMACGIL